jgi:pectate lyase
MLIGNSDSMTSDNGKLRVTLHHNHFHGCKERTPRVRFGRAHVVSNLFSADHPEDVGYSLGVGIQSRLVSEHNHWQLPPGVTADKLIRRLKGSALFESGSRLNGQPVDLLAAWRAAHPGETLSTDVGWRPEEFYDTTALRSADANRLVEQIRAGAGPRLA